jgi:hypothetical protein
LNRCNSSDTETRDFGPFFSTLLTQFMSEIEYDNGHMSECSLVRLRSLPDGAFLEAKEAGWEGAMLHLTLPDGQPGPSSGLLVEIENESKLYLGEVRQCNGPAVTVHIEHALDRARLASMPDTWR